MRQVKAKTLREEAARYAKRTHTDQTKAYRITKKLYLEMSKRERANIYG